MMKNFENLIVSFKPIQSQIDEIKQWLFEEENLTREGFYCNWNIINRCYLEGRIATVSLKNKSIGFAVWSELDFVATIEIVEIKPFCRNKGIGRHLIEGLFEYFKDKNICVVDLQCEPASSEPIWRRIGFIDFPTSFNTAATRELYKILIPHLKIGTTDTDKESIELWDKEFHLAKGITPTWTWELNFKKGTRELVKAIIHPCYPDWKIQWKCKSASIREKKIKYFDDKEIRSGKFLFIKKLPELPIN